MSKKSVKEIVMQHTGYATEEEFQRGFFDEKGNTNLPIKNLKEAAEFAKVKMNAGETVYIVGDYDADGIMGTSILELGLEGIAAKICTRIPYRMTEGYGLKPCIIEEIDKKCPEKGLIITVDNGIASYDAIALAKEKGFSVIVLDHHSLDKALRIPPADIVVDPHVIRYSEDAFEDWCGAGLAYRFIKEIRPNDEQLLDKLLCYAAIATVADSVPLLRENRFIVKRGLENMVQKDKRTIPLGALLALNNLDRYISEKDIGFRIGPEINAPGRLYNDGAKIPLEFFTSKKDFATCFKEAENLQEINNERKKMKKEQVQLAKDIIANNIMFNDAPIVLASKGFHEGLAGIIAGALAEEYHTPVIVLAERKDGKLKGSGRSVEGVNLFDLLMKCKKEIAFECGGHAMACGMTVPKENYDDFANFLQDELEDFEPVISISEIPYDLVIQGTDVNEVMNDVRQYAPYGEGNPEIVFKIENYRLSPKGNSVYSTKGTDNSTIELNGMNSSAIGFFMTDKYMAEGCPKNVTLIGTIRDRYNAYNFQKQHASSESKPAALKNNYGTRKVGTKKEVERQTQVEIIDMQKAAMEVRATSLAEKLAAMSRNRK